MVDLQLICKQSMSIKFSFIQLHQTRLSYAIKSSQYSKQLMKAVLLCFLPFLLMFHLGQALSSPQQVTPTTKFSFSGTQVFSTAPYYPSGISNVNSLLYTINFATPMNDSIYKSAIAIEQIYAHIPSRAYNLTVMLYVKNPSNLKFDMWSNTISNIQSMTIRYMIIASNWVSTFSFYWFMQYATNSLSSSSPYIFSRGSLSSVNMTGTVNSFSCLTGFDATAANSANDLSLILSVTRDSSTSIAGTLSSLSTAAITVNYFSFNLLSYNLGQITALPGKITMGFISATNAGALKYSSLALRQYNTLFGLSGFHIKNEGFLSWNGTLTVNSSIDVTSNNNFLQFQFIYLVLEQNWCIESNPYLIISTSTCYDVCPDGYYVNSVGLTCEICLYDCFQCTNATACSACNSTTDFRQLNTTTSRCTPLTGYYDNGLNQTVALPCSSSCLTCTTTSTNCLTCAPGMYLSGISCLSCSVTNCNNCTSSTNCFNCLTPYSLSGGACILNCSLAISNCSSCTAASSTVTCTICLTGFFLNTTDNTCTIICGDGILANTEQCDDGNTGNGDGCSSICTIQSAFFCSGAVGSISSCSNCLTNCVNCSSSTSCTLCATNYQLNSNTSNCQANCSLVPSCATCSVINSSVACSSCISGYVVDASNSCITKCGDGIVMGSEQCDDNNSVDGDGCSSTCTIEAGFFCQGATLSLCYSCLAYCSSCTNNVSCTTCDTLASWNSTTLACQASCSQLPNCLNCTIATPNTPTQFIQCSACLTGFSVDFPLNACVSICGDGLVLGGEGCDDGNNGKKDGCSDVCVVETGFFCVGSPSVCSQCLQYCNTCTNSSTWQFCNPITVLDPTGSSCSPICSFITYCNSCQIPPNANSIQCLGCSGGYSVDPSSNTCMPICGDGLAATQQQCDDGNLNNGDGCNSSCQIEQYYSCNVTATLTSQCFLSGLNISLIDITKSNGQNSGVMSFQPSPASLPLYNSVNWTSIISSQNPNVNITSASYDPSTNRINVDFSYSSSIQSAQIKFQVNTLNNGQLAGVTPFNLSLKAQADDNQALEYYSQSQYGMAKMVKYLALTAAASAILFLVLGIIGGRIVSLECSGVIQLSFISTLTLQNLSPTFNCLQSLSISLGYNKLREYDYSQSIDRPFKSAALSQQYIYNYNAMGVVILIPLLAAIVCKIISKVTKDSKRMQIWVRKAKLCVGQFTLYALLSFSYLAFLSLFIELKYMKSLMMDFVGVGIGMVLVAGALFYLFFYAKATSFYTEFKQKFNSDGFGSRFYVFPILQRILVPAILIQMIHKSYGNALIIAIYALMAVLVLVKQPYKGEKQNYRPFLNYIIVILVQGVYLAVNFANDPKGMLSLYGPFVVLGLLMVCVAYSAYALVKDLKQSFSQCQAQNSTQQDNSTKLQQVQMREFTAKMLGEQAKKFLGLQSSSPINPRKGSDSLMFQGDSARKINLTNVKQQLLSLKKTQNSMIDVTLQPQNISKMLQQMDESL